MLSWPNKDPDAVLDYKLDWTKFLSGDTITASTWTLPAGLTNSGDSFTDTSTTIWLSGGTAGTKYTAHNQITTSGGRTEDRSVQIFVKEK